MNSERNRFIDALKGLLAIMVVLTHYSWQNGEEQTFLFCYIINFAVPMFIFISGYLSAVSFEKKGINSFREAYSLKVILPKFLRLAIPFTIAFVAEWVIFRILGLFEVGIIEFGLFAFCIDWIKGGYGMGSYYFPIMVQFIFIVPVIFMVVKAYGKKGLWGCFFANAVFELLKTAYGMNDYEYRLLFFRYIFVASAGVYLALYGARVKNKWLEVVELVIGAGFVYLFTSTGYEPKVLNYWRTTCFPTCLFIVPIMNFLISKVKRGFLPLEVIGKASFNVFLVQMIYYSTYFEYVNAYVSNYVLCIVYAVIICVVAGLLFYFAESRITSFVVKKLMVRLNKS